MADRNKIERRPALIIGAGGTGVKTLRLIKLLADRRGDAELGRMLDNEEITLFGVDTDDDSFSDKRIDANVLRRPGDDDPDEDDHHLAGVPLPKIRHFVSISTKAITTAREVIQNELNRAGNGDDVELDAEHRHILAWHPKATNGGYGAIGLGYDNQAGAGQYRFLGRIGLFLHASQIYDNLRERLNGPSEASRLRGGLPLQAIIVCSLAGGTGSGMFWDLAFMLRDIDKELQIKGFFLLPGAFENVDKAGRIRPNTYAALKELVHYKNWRQRETFVVEYPIQGGVSFRARPNDNPAFQSVFLFDGGVPPARVKASRINFIDLGCRHIAQNILAHLRQDVAKVIQVAANNESGDTTAQPSSKEGGYVFSTLGTTEFNFHRFDDLKTLLFEFVLGSLIERTKGASLSLNAFQNEVRGVLPTWGGGASLILDIASEQEKALPEVPERLRAMIERLTKGAADLAAFGETSKAAGRAGAGAGPRSEQFAKLKRIYLDVVPQPVRDRFETFYRDAGNADKPLGVFGEEEALDYYRDELSKGDERFDVVVAAVRKLLDERGEGLDAAALKYLAAPVASPPPEPGAAFSRTRSREIDLANLPTNLSAFFRWVAAGPDATPAFKASPGVYGVALQMLLEKLRRCFEQFEGFENAERSAMVRRHIERGVVRYARALEELRVLSESKSVEKKRRQDELERIAREEVSPRRLRELGRLLLSMLRFAFERVGEEYDEGKSRSEVANKVAKRAARLASQSGVDSEAVGDPERWDKALRAAVGESDEENAGFIAEMFFEILGLPAIGEAMRLFVDKLKVATQAFAEYWITRPDLLLAAAGGGEGVKAQLRECKSSVFENGAVDNKVHNEKLVFVPPIVANQGASSNGARPAADQNDLFDEIDRIVRETLPGSTLLPPPPPSSTPIIYYHDMFRSPLEVADIGKYYRSYRAIDRKLRPYYHLHDGAEKLSEIYSDAVDPARVVFCGNPACDYDIRQVARTVIVCPGCRRPIRNRCGNPNCDADDVAERVSDLETQCPECRQEMRSYWWRCDKPEHQGKAMPRTSEYCSECDKEERRRPNQGYRISRQPGLPQIECPGCRMLGLNAERVTTLPPALEADYRNGVAAERLARFQTEIEAVSRNGARFDGHRCRASAEEHFLFPTCPEGAFDPKQAHHLVRVDGTFVCRRHRDKRFYVCHHCDYPIDAEDPRLARGEALPCPRCLRDLRRCHYCSDRDGTLFQGEASDGGAPARCPRCRNFMVRDEGVSFDTLSADLAAPAMCTNLFDCRAGRDVWITTAEKEHEDCRACARDRASLYDFTLLSDAIDKCPLCLMLVGKKSGETIQRSKLRDVSSLVWDTAADVPLDAYCNLCAVNLRSLAAWMRRDCEIPSVGVAVQGGGMQDQQQPTLSPMSPVDDLVQKPLTGFADAFDLLQVLFKSEDDGAAHREMLRNPKLAQLLRGLDQGKHDIISVFDRNRATSKGLLKRLEAIQKLHERHRQQR